MQQTNVAGALNALNKAVNESQTLKALLFKNDKAHKDAFAELKARTDNEISQLRQRNAALEEAVVKRNKAISVRDSELSKSTKMVDALKNDVAQLTAAISFASAEFSQGNDMIEDTIRLAANEKASLIAAPRQTAPAEIKADDLPVAPAAAPQAAKQIQQPATKQPIPEAKAVPAPSDSATAPAASQAAPAADPAEDEPDYDALIAQLQAAISSDLDIPVDDKKAA